MALPTAQQLAEARALQNNGVGQLTGGGGASSHGMSMAYAQWLQSPMGQLYARVTNGDQSKLKAAFEMENGGGTNFTYGQRPDQPTMDRFLGKMFAGQGGQQMGGGGQASMGLNPLALAQLQQNQTNPSSGGGMGQNGLASLGPEAINALFMLATMQDSDARNAAVKKRETEIRKEMDDLYDRTMGRTNTLGQTQMDDIDQDAYDTKKNNAARLARQGLLNTTTLTSNDTRSDMNAKRQRRQVEESVNREINNLDLNQKKDKYQFVERITDRVPDQNMIMNLASQLGAASTQGNAGGAGGSAAQQALQQLLAGQQGQRAGRQGPQMTPWGPLQQAGQFGGMFRQPVVANPILGNPANPNAAIFGQQNLVNQFMPQRQPTRMPQPTRRDRRTPKQYAKTASQIVGDVIANLSSGLRF